MLKVRATRPTQLIAPKVNLLVSGAADSQAFVMPNFVGQPLGTVSRTLQDAGFRLGNVMVAAVAEAPVDQVAAQGTAPAPPAQPSPASIIVTQVPAAGQKVVAGTMVNFEVR